MLGRTPEEECLSQCLQTILLPIRLTGHGDERTLLDKVAFRLGACGLVPGAVRFRFACRAPYARLRMQYNAVVLRSPDL